MEKTLKLLSSIILFLTLSINCNAQSYLEAVDDFICATPENEFNITADDFGYESIINKIQFPNILNFIIKILNFTAKQAFPLFLTTITIVLLFQLVNNFNFKESPLLSSLISNVSMCAIMSFALRLLYNNISVVEKTIEKTQIFSTAAVPAVTAISISSGSSLSAVVFSTSISVIYSLFQYIADGLLVPLLTIFITIGLSDNFSNEFNFSSLCALFKKWIYGIIVAFVGLFSLSITVQNILTSTNDSFIKKSIRYAVSKLIPLVGTSLSGGLETMFALASTTGTTLSIFGMLVIFSLFLPVIVGNLIYGLILSACKYICDFFGLNKLSNTIGTIAESFYILCAVISGCAFILIATFLLVCLNLR